MYLLFGFLFPLLVFFYIIGRFRKRRIIRRICRMDCCEKHSLLSSVIEPFGFTWEPDQDIISSTLDAWQREFGYHAAFDKAAVHFNMVFDSKPIYFDYDGRTWLIEFWKGQYGINTGAEAGIYRADSIISPDDYKRTLFHAVPDEEMLPFTLELVKDGRRLFSIRRLHWWLTGFRMGEYSEPEDLVLNISLTFPDKEMQQRFIDSLCRAGYNADSICTGCRSVSFTFAGCRRKCKRPCFFRRISCAFSQWKNRLFCKIFLWITRPFTCTADRLLYLYYFIPFAFRRMLRIKRCRGWKCPKHKKCRKHSNDRPPHGHDSHCAPCTPDCGCGNDRPPHDHHCCERSERP